MSGQVPLSFLGGAAIVASAVDGADTVYLGCAINTLYWRVFSSPEIKNVADLKGKKIGVTTIGSQEDSVVRYLLKERGLNPERDVTVVAVGSAPTRLAALSKGFVQASTFIPPQDIAAEKLGLNVLIDMSKLGLYNPGSCFASTKTYVRSHRDSVMRVMKAFVEGLKFYRDNKDFALKVTADFAQNRTSTCLTPPTKSSPDFKTGFLTSICKASSSCSKLWSCATHELRHSIPPMWSIRVLSRNWKKPVLLIPSGSARRAA